MTIKIQQPITKEDFEQYFHLRWKLLRAPWNEPEGSEQDELEDQCFHLMAEDGNQTCIAVGRLQLNTETEAQIRYMAVEKTHEGKGIGQNIVIELEKIAIEKMISIMVLDAREPAVGFYEKLGYINKEKSYLLFNSIQHYRMEKRLDR